VRVLYPRAFLARVLYRLWRGITPLSAARSASLLLLLSPVRRTAQRPVPLPSFPVIAFPLVIQYTSFRAKCQIEQHI